MVFRYIIIKNIKHLHICTTCDVSLSQKNTGRYGLPLYWSVACDSTTDPPAINSRCPGARMGIKSWCPSSLAFSW